MKTLRKLLVAISLLSTLFYSCGVFAAKQLNMTPGVTSLSRDIYDLHMTILWICVGIGAVVFGIMFYAIIFHRKSRGAKAANFHGSTTIEIVWTVIPFIILVAMAFPATRVLMNMYDTGKADVTIKIVAHQWYWTYEYLDEGIKFDSNIPSNQRAAKKPTGKNYLLEVDNPMVIPIGKKIRFLITSEDVIHAWWVPSFGVKKDAVPGFIHEQWTRVKKEGIYRGQCAELCGTYHGYMPIVVRAISDADYAKWVAEKTGAQKHAAAKAEASGNKTYTKDELLKLGEEKYNAVCAACHKPDGSGTPPMFPALKGGPIVVGPVAGHINIVLHGKKGTAMASYSRLSDTDIAAIVTYERNSWGNDSKIPDGKIVQPAEIKAAR